ESPRDQPARNCSGRKVAFDALGAVAGGLIAGGLGIAWLWGSGAWPYFLDVFLHWNPEHIGFARSRLWTGEYIFLFLGRFLPWIVVHVPALFLALLALYRAGSAAAGDSPEVCAVVRDRALLAAFYIGWLLQALLLQSLFDYVHVPPVLLAITVVAC